MNCVSVYPDKNLTEKHAPEKSEYLPFSSTWESRVHAVIIESLIFRLLWTNWILIMLTLSLCVSVILCHTSFSASRVLSPPPLIAPLFLSSFSLSSSVFCSSVSLWVIWIRDDPLPSPLFLYLPLSLSHCIIDQSNLSRLSLVTVAHTQSGLNHLPSSRSWFLLDKTINWARKGKEV